MSALPNAAEIDNWNDAVGRTWALLHERLDRQIAPFGAAAMAKAGLQPTDRVLDVGCGCGETSLRIAPQVETVLGVDVSAMLLDIAREAAAQTPNLAFLQADAQTHAFDPGAFDVLFSRFGVMFFEDPQAAFANLRGALKPAGRLAFCCWRTPAENPYLSAPFQAAAHLLPPSPPGDPTAPGPFAFADGERVRRILQEAGFGAVQIEPFDVQLAGGSLDETVVQALRMGPLGSALRQAGADDDLKRRVEAALREGMARYVEDGVVTLGGAVWVVSAGNR